jgi:hypothetical protein
MTIPQMQLEQLINERRQHLMSYAQKTDANEYYIQKENKLIQSLTEIYNGIMLLEYQELWKEVEDRLKFLNKIDKNFSGIQLELRSRPKGELCYQTVNLFDDGI